MQQSKSSSPAVLRTYGFYVLTFTGLACLLFWFFWV